MGQRAPKAMKNGSCSLEPQSLPLVIPERTRIPYFVAIARTTGAVSLKGNRMKLINATILDRKSGGSAVEGPAVQRSFLGNGFSTERLLCQVITHPSLLRPGMAYRAIPNGLSVNDARIPHMPLLLILVILLLVFGGGGYYMGPGVGYYGGGGLSIVLLIVILFLLFGRGRSRL
jgi:hypothetical protein